MFRPENIQKATLFFPRQVKEKLFHQLHEGGVCEIAKDENTVVNAELSESLELLHYVHRMQNRFSPFLGKVKATGNNKQTKYTFKQIANELVRIDTRSQELLKTISESESQIEKTQEQIQILNFLPKELKTEVLEKTPFCNVEVGTLPTDELAKMDFTDIVYSTKVVSDDQSLLIAFGQDKIEKVLFEHGFIRLDFEKTDKTANQLMQIRATDVKNAKTAIDSAKKELTKIAQTTSPTLLVFEEEVDIFVRELTGMNQSTNYDSFSSVVCWVTESKKEDFEKVLAKEAKTAVYIYETEHETAPTQLKNGILAKPFELITKLYSTPKSRGFDPTFFIAFTFPLFFGLMLTDFAYGLAMFLFATALFLKTPKRDEGVRNFSALLVISGVSTMAFGIIFGSYFGNFFQDVLHWQVPQLLDSMQDIIPMIAIVLAIGILHISLGLVVGFIESFKQKRYFDAFKEQGVWIVFVASVLMLLAGGLLKISFLNSVGLGTMAVSVMMQFILSFKKDGPITAVLALFDFSGFMGDVFSYIRLMALAIGTSGIALAVNFMVVMANDMIPYVGFIFAILIFIVGHLFNLVMNGLGGFIHTLRLHFLEHFSKYYDGGGSDYTPYYANRKQTTLAETKK